MTPTEYKVAATALAKEIGDSAEVFTSINSRSFYSADNDGPMYVSLYVDGLHSGRDAVFSLYATDFDDALAMVEAKWAEHSAVHRRQVVRKMALRIIELTAAHGCCLDAALRGDKFTATDVKRYGVEACADANAIAGKGPFTITTGAAANGAPEEAEIDQ